MEYPLKDAFIKNSLNYLSLVDFPFNFVLKEYREYLKKNLHLESQESMR